MDRNTLRSELRQLSAIVDDWTATDSIPAIERDLVLAKLQRLYEIVRFDAVAQSEVAPAEEPFAGSVVVGAADLDLAEGLSFGGSAVPASEVFAVESAEEGDAASIEVSEAGAEAAVPGAEPEVEVRPEFATEPEEASVATSETAAASKATSAHAAASGPAPISEVIPAVEPAPAAAVEADSVPVPSPESVLMSESAPAVVAEPVVASDAMPVDEPESSAEEPNIEPASAAAAEVDPASVPSPESASMSEVVPAVEPDPVPASEPAPAVAAEQVSEQISGQTAARSVSSTLFGPEEAVVRHRHKQRVIMSLYDPDPVLPSRRMPAPVVKPAPAPEDFAIDGSEPAASRTETPAVVAAPDEAPAAVAAAVAATVAVPTGAPAPQPQSDELPERRSEPQSAPDVAPDAVPASAPHPAAEPAAASASAVCDAACVAVLGEAVNHDVQTLADTFAPQRDRADELACEAVDDLRRAIGINDKFLLIRDLFGGDAAACDAAIATLDGFDNLDDCMIHIAENYAWNANSDGAKFLMALLERKFA